jgi:tRNA(Ile)-lysidine synthase
VRPAAAEAAPGPAGTAGRRLLDEVRGAFDRRLDPGARAPLAVGFSGGGDSLALLLAARAWADEAGRALIVLTVDHGLQPASAGWTDAAGALAARLGLGFRPLAWTGPKPAHGLPAAARAARHRLLAAAAREAGACVLLLGHTADDVLESERMRQAGSSVGTPREWSPSPAWPEGRGVFLLRPLLGLRRQALRRRLGGCGLAWIEDPANEDAAFARARARAALADAPDPRPPAGGAGPIPADAFAADGFGLVRLDRARLRRLPDSLARRLLSAACVSAGGGDRLPRRGRVSALLERLRGPGELTATLAGARLEAAGEVLICRDPGRQETCPQGLAGASAQVWDGRFEVSRPAELRPLRGQGSRLSAAEAGRLRRLPAMVRPTLPAVRGAHGSVTCPLLAERSAFDVHCLVGRRLAAAAGLVGSEAQAARGPDGEEEAGALS